MINQNTQASSWKKFAKITKKIKKTKELSSSKTIPRKSHLKTCSVLKNDMENKEIDTNSVKFEGNEEILLYEGSHIIQKNINLLYLEQILSNYLEKEKNFCPKEFLEKQRISGKLRGKMIDWLIEVYKIFGFDDQTFFLTVNLMDRYFLKAEKDLETKDIHLIGVTCLFISIKLEEPTPLKLSLMTSKIAHSKLTDLQILEKEIEILDKLSFELHSPTLLHFLETTIFMLKLDEVLENGLFQVFVRLVMYNAIMVLHDYEIIGKNKYSLIAASIILVSFKLLQKIFPEFTPGGYNSKIKSILQLDEKQILDTANQILLLAKNFDEVYGAKNNLKKYSIELFNELYHFTQ